MGNMAAIGQNEECSENLGIWVKFAGRPETGLRPRSSDAIAKPFFDSYLGAAAAALGGPPIDDQAMILRRCCT